jgi:hypothetical protein
VQVRRGVGEARDLTVLRGQVEDRVEDEEDEREVAVDARGGHVADDGLDPLGPRLVAQARQHRLGVVHARDAHAALRQRHGDPARANRELERRAVAGELREHVDGRVDHGGVEHAPRGVVVTGRDALAEVPLVCSHDPECVRWRSTTPGRTAPPRAVGSDAPARNRTLNLRIKSPLLCQLSYRGEPRMVAAVCR